MFTPLEKLLVLQRAPLFTSLAADDLLTIARLCNEVAIDANEELYQEGDLGEAMYVVARGQVIVERNQVIIATLGAGEIVGELSVLDWEPHSATVVAREPTLLLRLDRHDLHDLLAELPQLARSLSEMIVARVRRMARASGDAASTAES